MDIVDIDLAYKGETDAAIRFEDADGNTVWLPKSQITVDLPMRPTSGTVVSVAMPEWLAEEKDLL